METFPALRALCAGNWSVTGEFPSQRPGTRSSDVFFHLRLNKRLSKQSKRGWFETLSRSLWRHCNADWIAQRLKKINGSMYWLWFPFDDPLLWYWDGATARTCSDPLQWCHNERNGVSNHLRHECLLNDLFRPRSKKTSKLRVRASVRAIHRWPVNSPRKGPVTRKMLPFDDVIMRYHFVIRNPK